MSLAGLFMMKYVLEPFVLSEELNLSSDYWTKTPNAGLIEPGKTQWFGTGWGTNLIDVGAPE